MAGAILLIVLYAAAFCAGFLGVGMQDPSDINPSFPDHPPTAVYFRDQSGFRWPFVLGRTLEQDSSGRRAWNVDPNRQYPLRFFVKGFPYKVLGLFESRTHLVGVDEGGVFAPLGLDSSGRDVWTRTLYGARVSLSVGLVGIFLTLGIGMIAGGISGYTGGLVDTVIMRITELLMSVPSIYLILAVGFYLKTNKIFGVIGGEELGPTGKYLLIIVVLSFIGWAGPARVVRGIVLSVRENEYVIAARALGASATRILFYHVLPAALTFAIVAATVSVPGYILGEVTLSVLDLGVKEPGISWGLMLQGDLSVASITQTPWKTLAPAAGIFLTVMGFNFLGDGLRDALDPRHTNG